MFLNYPPFGKRIPIGNRFDVGGGPEGFAVVELLIDVVTSQHVYPYGTKLLFSSVVSWNGALYPAKGCEIKIVEGWRNDFDYKVSVSRVSKSLWI